MGRGREAECYKCGWPIEFGIDANGRPIPLDRRAVVYRAEYNGAPEPHLEPVKGIRLNHLTICPALYPPRKKRTPGA